MGLLFFIFISTVLKNGEIKMSFRLLIQSPSKCDGTSIYRCYGTLPYIQNEGLQITDSGSEVDWPTMLSCDAILMQRPFISGHVELAKFAGLYKRKLWIDYDDDLLSVPLDNPTSDIYNQKVFIENVKTLCGMADIVTVSTEALKERLAPFSKYVVTIPNGLDIDLLDRASPELPTNRCVVWRGSSSHMNDIYLHTEAILDAYKRFPDWSFVFFGYNPWWITRGMDEKRFRYVPFQQNYLSYMDNLKRMRGALTIVPLADNVFNHAKSRIAQLEASWSGSVALVPDWAEWKGGESFRYKDERTFKDQLFMAMSAPQDVLTKLNELDWNWVLENRTLQKTNLVRKGVIATIQCGNK